MAAMVATAPRPVALCQSCGAPSSDSEVDPVLQIARCRHCGGVSDADPAGQPFVPLPPHFVVHARPPVFAIEFPWREPWVLVVGAMALVWNAGLFTAALAILGADEPLLLLPLLPFQAVGAALAYWAVALFLNSTRVEVCGGALRVSHYPLRWPGARRFAPGEVKGLEAGRSSGHGVRARLGSGKTVALVGGLSSEEQALALVQQFGRRLHPATEAGASSLRERQSGSDDQVQLACRVCRGRLDEADARITLGIPRCPYCSSVQITRAAPELPDAQALELPAHFELREEAGRLEVEWRWGAGGSVALPAVFLVMFNLLLLCIAGELVVDLVTGEGSVFPLLMLTLHLGFAIFASYSLLAYARNSTRLVVKEGLLTVSHRPMRWPGSKSYARGELVQLFCTSRSNGRAACFEVHGVLRSGRRLKLLGRLPSAQIAHGLEHRLERAMDLQNARVGDEILRPVS